MLKSWIKNIQETVIDNKQKKSYKFNVPALFLDETYEFIDNIEEFKVNLYFHQKVMIKAMIDLENNRTVSIRFMNNKQEKLLKVRSNVGILSDPVGSGKTFSILGLIIHNETPKIMKNINYVEPVQYSKFCNYKKNISSVDVYYKKFKNILTVTLVFVGSSVIKQWTAVVKKFTSLKYFVIENISHLEKFINLTISKKICQYDLVLIKNGKVTRHPNISGFLILMEFLMNLGEFLKLKMLNMSLLS